MALAGAWPSGLGGDDDGRGEGLVDTGGNDIAAYLMWDELAAQGDLVTLPGEDGQGEDIAGPAFPDQELLSSMSDDVDWFLLLFQAQMAEVMSEWGLQAFLEDGVDLDTMVSTYVELDTDDM